LNKVPVNIGDDKNIQMIRICWTKSQSILVMIKTFKWLGFVQMLPA